MGENTKNKYLFGLLGKNISYSFSRGYFSKWFKSRGLENYEYVNFDIQNIEEFTEIIKNNHKDLKGLNVTIPYKLSVFEYLDKIDKKALKIGAVNTIKITKKGRLKGYNTDVYGFKKSLQPLLQKHHDGALILGTGGASKAVAYVLDKLDIKYFFVSRNPKKANEIAYEQLSKEIMNNHSIIINCTPLGTHPKIDVFPNIPYQWINNKHLFYDLIYNPSETLFLKKAKEKGAKIKNGLEMLELQAKKSWKIWGY